uniref:TrmB family transcriptional regulator n=1 Tax=Fervidicoccus fontis TaxID=683846 RepID=A0A7J3ZJ87_9CREN
MSATRGLESLEERLRTLLGLNKYEARLYLAILKGARGSKQAAEASGVPLPRVYDVVKSLESKGLVKPSNNWYVALDVRESLFAFASRVVSQAVERAEGIMRLAEELARHAEHYERVEEAIEVIRGLREVLARSFAMASRARTVYLLAWKALERLNVIKPFLASCRPLIKGVDVRLIIPAYFELTDSDVKLLRDLGIKWIKTAGSVMLDSMIIDDHTVIIGVPDPNIEGEAMAIVVNNKAFASAVRRLADKIWFEGEARGLEPSA